MMSMNGENNGADGDNKFVLRSATRPRAGWEEACRRMHEHGDDALLDQGSSPATKWDRTEWQW
jgi:hypothetical protein